MEETPDAREVDELLASMDTTAPPGVVLHSPRTPLPQYAPLIDRPASPPATVTSAEETDRRKPTLASTPRSTPRLKSQRSSSSSSRSSSPAVLPVLNGNNEPPPATTTSATSPRPTVVVPLTTTPAPSEGPCDLDALSELLRTESQTSLSAQQRLAVETSSGHASASVSEPSDKPSMLPPLLSSSHKSLSFAPQSPANKGTRRATMLEKQASLTISGPLTQVPTNGGEDLFGSGHLSPRQFQSPHSAPRLNRQNMSPSRRRLTIGTHEISPHALERLGVNTDILKKEKGMKKLGISDVDIERFEEIRRYSGVPMSLQPVTKVEFMFGFTKEQLMRVKAINRLGTSEEEVQDEYSRQVSRLGIHDVPIVQN